MAGACIAKQAAFKDTTNARNRCRLSAKNVAVNTFNVPGKFFSGVLDDADGHAVAPSGSLAHQRSKLRYTSAVPLRRIEGVQQLIRSSKLSGIQQQIRQRGLWAPAFLGSQQTP